MSRTIMIMAGASGSGYFGSGKTRAPRAFACAEMTASFMIRGPIN